MGAATSLEAAERIARGRIPNAYEGGEKLKLDDALERFLSWASRHVKPRTHQQYRVSAKRLLAYFGAIGIERMNTQSVEGFKSVRAGECTLAGVNRDLACLRTFRDWCGRMGYPISRFHVQLFPEGPGNMRIVSYEEERIYLQHADPLLRDVSTIIVETGMRPGEVFGAQGEHVNLEWRYIFVPTGKTRFARRTIPLTNRVCGALGRLWKNGKLFEGVATNQIVMRRHKELCKRLGFDFRLYDFRHTYGSRMAMAGVDLMTLKELMGHSSITLTQRYCHPTPEHKVSAMERLEAYNAERATKKPQSQTEANPMIVRKLLLAEREGFPACENADCTPCCWEGHSTLCYTARGGKGKSDVRHPSVKPLDLRNTLSWTNRTNRPVLADCTFGKTSSPE